MNCIGRGHFDQDDACHQKSKFPLKLKVRKVVDEKPPGWGVEPEGNGRSAQQIGSFAQ
jgi:hypothetical protein